MTENLNESYRNAAEEFACRVVASLGDQIDSIVLYGSVARGEATADSDIDVLVVSPDPKAVWDKVSDICADFAYELNYEFFISLVDFARADFYRLKEIGSPFIETILREGVILYDNGVFSRGIEEDMLRTVSVE